MFNIGNKTNELIKGFMEWLTEYTDDFVLFIATVLLLHILYLITTRLFKKFIKKKIANDEKRAETYYKIVRDLIKYLMYVIYLFLFLQSLGISLTLLVTSIGALSVIIGIASQELIMDMIKGIIILVDNYYSVGDYIKCATYEGYVVDFKIRATVLKTYNNEVIIIPNSNIENITNYSKMDPFIFSHVPISYEHNIVEVEENLVPVLIETLLKDDDVNDIEYFGLSNLNDSSYTLMFSIHCEPEERFIVQRKLNREFMILCNKLQYKVPYNKLLLTQE